MKNLKLKSKFYIDKRFGLWYNEYKIKKEIEHKRRNVMFDFGNKDYGIMDAVNDAKTKPEVALWFTNQIKDSDLARIFVRKWLYKMDGKEDLTNE